MINLSILLIEDNDDHATFIEKLLQRSQRYSPSITRERSLDLGIQKGKSEKFDIILLDLNLPDSEASETLARTTRELPETPIIILTSLDSKELGEKAVDEGAQDFLIKSELGSDLLNRSIRYSISRKKLTTELKQYAAKLERSNQELQRFSHTLAHEVKSPLNVVMSCINLLDRRHGDIFDSTSSQFIRETETAIEGLKALVHELLEIAEASSENCKAKSFDCEVILKQAINSVSDEVENCHCKIAWAKLPTISADPLQIKHLFQNLIQNAIKYRSNKSPQIEIGSKEEGDEWSFYVKDNGMGIAQADITRIFNAFVRLHKRTEIPGTGIGLSFCKQIVERHGGRIWAISEIGKGSTFFFTIPKNASSAQPSVTQ